MTWTELQGKIVWGAITALFAGMGWLGTQVIAKPSTDQIRDMILQVSVSRAEIAAIARIESPYIEDRKLIERQFQSFERILDAMQTELRAVRSEVVGLRIILHRQQTPYPEEMGP